MKETETALSGPARVLGSVVDVADAEALSAWVRSAAEALGGLDIVVPNVSALVMQADEAGWRTAFEVDLMHTVRMSRPVQL